MKYLKTPFLSPSRKYRDVKSPFDVVHRTEEEKTNSQGDVITTVRFVDEVKKQWSDLSDQYNFLDSRSSAAAPLKARRRWKLLNIFFWCALGFCLSITQNRSRRLMQLYTVRFDSIRYVDGCWERSHQTSSADVSLTKTSRTADISLEKNSWKVTWANVSTTENLWGFDSSLTKGFPESLSLFQRKVTVKSGRKLSRKIDQVFSKPLEGHLRDPSTRPCKVMQFRAYAYTHTLVPEPYLFTATG